MLFARKYYNFDIKHFSLLSYHTFSIIFGKILGGFQANMVHIIQRMGCEGVCEMTSKTCVRSALTRVFFQWSHPHILHTFQGKIINIPDFVTKMSKMSITLLIFFLLTSIVAIKNFHMKYLYKSLIDKKIIFKKRYILQKKCC